MEQSMAYARPGNVRELTTANMPSWSARKSYFHAHLPALAGSEALRPGHSGGRRIIEEGQRERLIQVMEEAGGNRQKQPRP